MRLSILIPSVHTRRNTFVPRILQSVFDQYEQLSKERQKEVEILFLLDNKSMVLGDKRNELVRMASGDYVVFVDDDDRIEPDYIETVLHAVTTHDCDVVTWLVNVSLDGKPPTPCVYSLRWSDDQNAPHEYRRLPNHMCAIKRELVEQTPFPSLICGEDTDFAHRIRKLLRTEHHIDRVLYHYDYDPVLTETQREPPVADVIVLSKADTPDKQAMTQRTVDSCWLGTGSKRVRIFVIEQIEDVSYKHATTVHQPAKFNYNAFANQGARLGDAEWIMIANNDLDFARGWLEPLLSAKHPIVSPFCPGDRRQIGIYRNTKGYKTGTHLSGWCFMIHRELWERIGGFDEDFPFWCADDSLVEQLRAIGVEPMLVHRSRVSHLVSQTLKNEPAPGDLTWAGIRKFSEKYRPHPMIDHPQYIQWEQENRK